MADSRRASRIFLDTMKESLVSRLGVFLLVTTVSYLLGTYVLGPDLDYLQQRTLVIILMAVGLWVSEAIPPFAVGILIIGFLVYTHGAMAEQAEQVDISKYFNTWSSEVIWLMLGGFFLAKGMENTDLDKALFAGTLKLFGRQPRKLLAGFMLTTALGSMVMSNTATTAMMIASITPFLNQIDSRRGFPKALLLGIPAAASVGGMGTIIGSPPNAIAVGALAGVGIQVSFLEWMIIGIPLAVTLTLLFWMVLVRKFRISVEPLPSFEPEMHEHQVGDRRKKTLVIFTTALTMFLWMAGTLHGIPSYVVSLIPIVFLTVGGVVHADNVRTLPWDTLMLVAGGLSLGIAIVDTGLAELYLGKIEELVSSDIVYPIILLLALVTVVASNIMSNTATASILIPVSIIMFPSNGMLAAVVIGLSASAALFLPISTPPNAIAFSTGRLQQKDFRLGGISIGLSAPVLIMLWSYFLIVVLK